MAYVAINVLSVPEGRGELLELRFAARAGAVEGSPGFERFELLRPVEGTDQYLVYTRWRSRADFEAWTASSSFAAGHRTGGPTDGTGATAGHPGAGAEQPVAAASGALLWAFEVATAADPA